MLFQVLGGREDAGVFDRRNHDGSWPLLGESEDGQVIGFGAAAGEQQLVAGHALRAGTGEFKDFLASGFKDPSGGPSKGMLASRVCQPFVHQFVDNRSHARIERGSRVVIEIDWGHGISQEWLRKGRWQDAS